LKRIDLLFENEHCLVLNKPAGLAVQGGKGVGASLDTILENEFSPRPLLVHRLDKDTSGLIITAKSREAAALLSALFAGRALEKRYLALCSGRTDAAGLIDENLPGRGTEQSARTKYRRLGGNGDFSLLEIETETGRMHQIRRHMASSGHPVLGDDKYGDFALNKRLRKTMSLRHLLLHASSLVIPADTRLGLAAPLEVRAPPPDYFDPFLSLFHEGRDEG
jgi:23S rRNA pseudouridine955/2504/2580 synthase